MTPGVRQVIAAVALPLAITHQRLDCPRRVWVRDPAGEVLAGRQGVLEAVTCLGGVVECCHVSFDAVMSGRFPPGWVHELATAELSNVVPFPVRG